MNIIDSHIHICRCINGFGNSGEMQAGNDQTLREHLDTIRKYAVLL